MDSVGVRQLKENASRIVRRVRENRETIAITYRGEIVARLEPVEHEKALTEDLATYWAELDQLIADIAKHAPSTVDASGVMREMRRDL